MERSSRSPRNNEEIRTATSDVAESQREADVIDAQVKNFASDDAYPVQVESSSATVTIPVHKDDFSYNMTHKNRGKCVIFNHEFFDTDLDSRTSSVIDVSRIENTFKILGFQVEIYSELYYNEIIAKVTELSNENHTDNDCICIFVLTHGTTNDLISARDHYYNLGNIWTPFTADNCPTLAGKPKLFFFQTCRGNKRDSGVKVLERNRPNFVRQAKPTVESYKLPTHADFLIAHSTPQGFLSWKHPLDGTWYIQTLCDVIDQYWMTKDLLSMLTITARKVATDYASYNDLDTARHDQKQVPSLTSMLIRDVYFAPK